MDGVEWGTDGGGNERRRGHQGGGGGWGGVGHGGGGEGRLTIRTLYYLMKFILIDDVGASFFGKDPGRGKKSVMRGQLGYPIP